MTPAAPQLARRIADAFEAAGIPHAIGGALALAVWGFPRATNDVDLDVFTPPEDLPRVFAALRAAGCAVDDVAALQSAGDRGDFCAACAGSANFTEAARDRNIEAGVLLDHPRIAEALAGRFRALHESGRLKKMSAG